MAFVKLSLVLALFCGIVSASWGPSNLTAHIDGNAGDFVDINVDWKAGSCPVAHFKVYTEAARQEKKEETSTSQQYCTIKAKEFWTNYTIILETSLCLFDEKPRVITLYTGPGSPHKVKDVVTVPSAIDVNVTIEEASMPRPVDQYNVTWCSVNNCQTQIFTRNNHGAAATYDLSLKQLHPNTAYNLTVVPEISFNGTAYRGSKVTTHFVTKNPELPVPTDVVTTFPRDANEKQGVELTWKLPETEYQLAFYNVTVTSDADPAYLRYQKVEKADVIFSDMPSSASLVATITPVFNITKQLMHHNSSVIRFDTPQTAVNITSFGYASLSSSSIFAAWNISVDMLPNAVTYEFSYTDPKNITKATNVTGTSFVLDKLLPGTPYEVVISVVAGANNTDVFSSNFTTLPKDYAAPENITAVLLGDIATASTFNVTWKSDAVPVKASSFQVDSCDVDTKKCIRNETTAEQVVVPLEYFSNYEITVTAIYELKFNQSATRPGQTSALVTTPGTEPLPVTKVALKSVTTSDATLVWNAPANVPKNVPKVYRVSDAANNLIGQSETEQIQLSKLLPYSFYSVNIEPVAHYGKKEYTGNQTLFAFYTDAAAPGAPATVTFEQIARSNIVKVFWTPPTVQNGPLDYYEVSIEDSTGKVVSNLTNLVGSNSATLTLNSAHGDEDYTVSVRAVNVNLNKEALAGNASEATFSFKGLAAPTAEVVERLSDSLTFKLTPSNTTEDTTGLFYVLRNGENTFPNASDHIKVTNLTAYTNETVEVYACYSETFCSESTSIVELTNVGGPSPVTNLAGNFKNRTIPYINWTAPEHLNGPLDGYLLNLKDSTNSSIDIKEVLPANQTSYVYETDHEFEKYIFTVSGFNYDLEKKDVRVVGQLSSVLVNTTGVKPPKPDNVQEVNKTSTSFSLEWEKPQYDDFDVTFYMIEVDEMNIKKLTNETHFTLEGLKPWTHTTVLTRGCTTDNETTCGDAGSYLLVTAVDKPSEPQTIAFTNVTQTEALASWKAPLQPNGPINGYRVAISESENKNLTWVEVGAGEALTHKFSNLTTDTKYIVHVQAYNVDEDTGEELPSQIATNNFTTVSSGGFAWWIIVVALIVVAAGIAIGTVVYKRRNAQLDDREQLVQA